jgi:superfamily II DNA or RNA helicase
MNDERAWQIIAKRKFLGSTALSFLLNATPGAGKTRFAAECSASLYGSGDINFTLIVVPTLPLKGDEDAGFKGEWRKCGIELKTDLKSDAGMPRDLNFRGAVITYQQLLKMVDTIENWVRDGCRLFVVFDEVHHLTESNRWGMAAERIGDRAVRILAMTGTAFRSDGRRISFVNYDAEGKAIADETYSYQDAVSDDICRSVDFMTDDGIAEYVKGGQEESARISEPETLDMENSVSRVIFRGDSTWLRGAILRADAKLDEYRTWDSDAGGLIVCRPGWDDTEDDRNLLNVVKLVRELTGEYPEVVYAADDAEDKVDKIERYRRGNKKWICAIRKISEGVDIKRLRVEVLASRPSTELLFRQVVGRIVRVDDEERPGDATVFMAKFPQLVEWAGKIRKEAEAGLKEIEERRVYDEDDEGVERNKKSFIPGVSTYEPGGAISDYGEEYTAAEISAAENVKRQAVEFTSLPTTTVAKLLRYAGKASGPVEPVGVSLQESKNRLKPFINKAARRLAVALRDNADQKPDFALPWRRLRQSIGVRSMDDLVNNYSIDVMEQALSLLNGWYRDLAR